MKKRKCSPTVLTAVLAMFLVATSASAAKVNIKLATQAPENSPWHKMLTDLDEAWQAATNGRVSMTIYPGGVSGDESDIIRKMRIGQLQGGALTVAGLTDLEPVVGHRAVGRGPPRRRSRASAPSVEGLRVVTHRRVFYL